MARNLREDEERNRRVILIGEFAIKTGLSTRKIAEYFSTNHFKISNATVHDYLDRYKKIKPSQSESIIQVIENNKEKTITDEEVKSRVLKVYQLIKEGFSVDEIAKALKENYWTIYRDIEKRLQKLDIDKYNEIKSIFVERVNNNIKK